MIAPSGSLPRKNLRLCSVFLLNAKLGLLLLPTRLADWRNDFSSTCGTSAKTCAQPCCLEKCCGSERCPSAAWPSQCQWSQHGVYQNQTQCHELPRREKCCTDSFASGYHSHVQFSVNSCSSEALGQVTLCPWQQTLGVITNYRACARVGAIHNVQAWLD